MTRARILADYVAGGSTAAEFDVLDGLTSTTAELNYVDGVTSNVQTQLDAKAPLADPDLTGLVQIATDASTEGLEIKSTGNTGQKLMLDSNLSSAADNIAFIQGKWDGTAVASMNFVTGADTSDKDDGLIAFGTATAGTLAERMRISSDGTIGINKTGPQGRFQILDATTGWGSISDKGRTDSATNMLIRSGVNGGTSMLLRCEANHPDCGGSSNDGAFTVQNDGTLKADSATIGTPADYAEYFESTDDSAISAGTTVVLENGKVRPAINSETPMGVIRPTGCSTTVGNASPMNYYSKYKRDVFGAHIYEEYTITAWTDSDGEYHNYPSDSIPNDLTVPDDAEIITHETNPEGYEVSPKRKLTRRIINPDYDPSKAYISREDRDEWNLVGLLGQVTILKGQLTASNWIKMWDIDSSHEMWFIK